MKETIEKNVPVCENDCVHEDVVNRVKEIMPDEENIDYLAELFKGMGDPTRLRILYALLQEEMCVCDIAELLGMTQSAISHQLRVLRNIRLVKHEKRGKSVYYSLDDEHVKLIFEQGFAHVSHTR